MCSGRGRIAGSMYVSVQMIADAMEVRSSIRYPKAGATGYCEPVDMDAKNWTQVLCKRN